MDLFPTPFTLGTSSANVADIIPATVHFDPNNPEKVSVGCHIGGVYYSNKNQSSLRDSNFATIVYNKKTEEVFVIHKRPEFLGPCFDDPEPVQTKESSSAISNTALISAFGSVKRQRMLKETERHAESRAAVLEVGAITKSMHGQRRLKRDNADAANAGEGSETVDERKRLLPPFSLSASRPVDVYPLGKLIPSRVMEALNSEAETLSTAPVSVYQTWIEQGAYRKCVLDRIVQLSSLSGLKEEGKASKNRLRIAHCLAYLNHLLALFSLSSHDIQRKVPLPDTPEVVARYVLNEFTVMINRGDSSHYKIRTMTPMLRDRLIYHMVAVVLHCDNFQTTLDELTVDFRMSSDRLRRYFVYMGCKVSKEDVKVGQDQVTRLKATLVTPVKFPEGTVHNPRRQTLLD